MKTNGRKIIGLLFMAFMGGVVALGLFRWGERDRYDRMVYQVQQTPVRQVHVAGMNAGGTDLTAAAQLSVHAVVHIKTQYRQKNNYYDRFFGVDPFFDFFRSNPRNNYPIVAAGSGVIISDNGYIVTNNHVVHNADLIEVTLNDKRTYEASIVGTDPSTDLSLLKIEATGLPYLMYGNSDAVKIGEWVLAVGNPFNLTSTVTAGIVSAKARDIQILGDISSVESFIQTDAAVNPGNSGGALVNIHGELIGINAAIASNTGSFTGYSFAIPSNLVRKIVNDFIEFGEVQRAYLGVVLRDIDGKFAIERKLETFKGVYVESVIENAAADKAGIKPGDIILRIEDFETNTRSELNEIVARQRPGDMVRLTVRSNGTEYIKDLTLTNREGSTGTLKSKPGDAVHALGATFEDCSPEQLRAMGINHGVRIAKLSKGKLFSVGIKEGFIIQYIDKKSVKSVDELMNILSGIKGTIQIEGVYPNGMRAYYGFNF
jgi:serine protease Do